MNLYGNGIEEWRGADASRRTDCGKETLAVRIGVMIASDQHERSRSVPIRLIRPAPSRLRDDQDSAHMGGQLAMWTV